MACEQEVQFARTVKDLDVITDAELQKLKEFDAEKINTLPRIQVRGTAGRPPRQRMQIGSQKLAVPRARDLVAAAYGSCPSVNQFGVDKTNLPTMDSGKLTRKRLEKLARFRI